MKSNMVYVYSDEEDGTIHLVFKLENNSGIRLSVNHEGISDFRAGTGSDFGLGITMTFDYSTLKGMRDVFQGAIDFVENDQKFFDFVRSNSEQAIL